MGDSRGQGGEVSAVPVLASPYYQEDRITIYHGDSTGFGVPSGCVVVSDPPYGIGYVKGEGGRMVTNRSKGANRNIEPVTGDDRPFDPSEWASSKDCILWGASHYHKRLPDGGRWIAWNKLGLEQEPFDSFCDVEFAWQNSHGRDLLVSLLWKGVLQGDKANNGKRWHPTQKPEALMRWCIGLVGCGETILDPYMGSGTTLVAAKQLGRHAIGIEVEERYCEIAVRRLMNTTPSLFGGEK